MSAPRYADLDDRGLADALARDDELEDAGMHGDDRRTCYQHREWADHAHDRITNERLTFEEYFDRYPDAGLAHGRSRDALHLDRTDREVEL